MKAERIIIAVLSSALLASACGGSEDSCDPCDSPPADYCADANFEIRRLRWLIEQNKLLDDPESAAAMAALPARKPDGSSR